MKKLFLTVFILLLSTVVCAQDEERYSVPKYKYIVTDNVLTIYNNETILDFDLVEGEIIIKTNKVILLENVEPLSGKSKKLKFDKIVPGEYFYIKLEN